MKKILIILNALFLLSPTYGFLGNSKKYVVSVDTASFYEESNSRTAKGEVPYGIALQSLKTKNNRIQFSYDDEDIWINENDLEPIIFNKENFSDTSVLFMSEKLDQNNLMWFVYKNVLYTMDLNNPRTPKIDTITKLPKLSFFKASGDYSYLLLFGDQRKGDKHSLNVAVFSVYDNDFIPLVTFDNDKVTLDSSFFSEDNKYLSILFNKDDTNYLHVYSVETSSLVFSRENVFNSTWVHSDLLVYTADGVELYDNWEESTPLYTYAKKQDADPPINMVGDAVLLEIEGAVYSYKNKVLEKTDYKSIERSESGTIEHYTSGGRIYTKYEGDTLRSLSGEKPRWTLLSIISDTKLIYKYQADALQIIGLYNALLDKTISYSWVEEPDYTMTDGVSIENVIDNNEVWVFIEKPEEWVEMLKLHELLP